MCGLRLQQMLGCSNWSLISKRKEMPEQNYAQPTVPRPTPQGLEESWAPFSVARAMTWT